MAETREVPVLRFFSNAMVDAPEFANDLVDAIDAKIQGGAYEELMDLPKGVLKAALADVITEKFHEPLADKTITCEA